MKNIFQGIPVKEISTLRLLKSDERLRFVNKVLKFTEIIINTLLIDSDTLPSKNIILF